jgi:hypothetical protein
MQPTGYSDMYDLVFIATKRISKAISGRMAGSLTKSSAEVVLDHFSKEEFGLVLEAITRGKYSTYNMCGIV